MISPVLCPCSTNKQTTEEINKLSQTCDIKVILISLITVQHQTLESDANTVGGGSECIYTLVNALCRLHTLMTAAHPSFTTQETL